MLALPARFTALLSLLLCVAPLPSARAQTDSYNEFVARFNKAREFKDEKLMDQAIKRDPDNALAYFSALNWEYKRRGDAASYEPIELMLAAWQRTFDTRTLEHYERFISSRGAQMQRALQDADAAQYPIFEAYRAALSAADREQLVGARTAAMDLARTYESLGHSLMAARMWSLAGEISGKLANPTLEDRKLALECFRSFVRQRDLWEWNKDSNYLLIQNRIKADAAEIEGAEGEADARRQAGYADDVRGIDALLQPNAEAVEVPLAFAAERQPHVDMFVHGGSVPGDWLTTSIINAGPARLEWLSSAEVYLVRSSATKYGVTLEPVMTEVKGHPIEEVEPSSKFHASVFHLDAAKTRPYAMWFWVGGEQETLAGVQQNLQPTHDQARVYYRSAASWVAEVGESKLTLYDDNASGKLFDGDPFEPGLLEYSRDPEAGVKAPTFDGMSVDGGPVHPLGDFVKIGDSWFNLGASEDGTKVRLRPVNPDYFKTGQVTLSWKGPNPMKPEVVVLSGEGDFANTHFNIAGGKPVEVPAGTYRLSFGRIVSGKGARLVQAHIYQGSMKPVKVAAGAETAVALGAPFSLDFQAKMEGEELVVDATTIAVVGTSGESYARIHGGTPEPELMIARSEKGVGAKEIGSFVAMDIDALNAVSGHYPQLGNLTSLFPVPKGQREGKLELKVRPPYTDGFIALQQPKHRAFGRLLPIWRKL
jgi:hypothetical protein